MSVAEQIVEALKARGPMTAPELARVIGAKKTTADAVVRRIEERGAVVRQRQGWRNVWAYAAEVPKKRRGTKVEYAPEYLALMPSDTASIARATGVTRAVAYSRCRTMQRRGLIAQVGEARIGEPVKWQIGQQEYKPRAKRGPKVDTTRKMFEIMCTAISRGMTATEFEDRFRVDARKARRKFAKVGLVLPNLRGNTHPAISVKTEEAQADAARMRRMLHAIEDGVSAYDFSTRFGMSKDRAKQLLRLP